MKRLLIGLALVLAGCKQGDGTVMVEVSSPVPLAGITKLHVTATTPTGATKELDVDALPNPVFPPAATFALVIGSTFKSVSVHVDALDAAGRVAAQGDGTGTITSGAVSTVAVMLANNALVCQFDVDTFDNGCVFGP